MTAIYCVKCHNTTNTKSEKLTTTANGRYRLAGICSICGTKKGMFVNSNGKVTKLSEELVEAKAKREYQSQRKRAEKIGWKIMDTPNAKECVNECLAKMRKQKK